MKSSLRRVGGESITPHQMAWMIARKNISGVIAQTRFQKVLGE
jgi:hypothetical protein